MRLDFLLPQLTPGFRFDSVGPAGKVGEDQGVRRAEVAIAGPDRTGPLA